MIDHISLRVTDLARALAFYRAALAPLGYKVMLEFPDAVGLGDGRKADFWITRSDQTINPTHIAFSARREAVDAFHTAALGAGGSDNGPPGPRPEYHPHYFGAFVRDPEGNNIEVVSHGDAPAQPRKSKSKPARRPVKASARTAPKKRPAPPPRSKPGKGPASKGKSKGKSRPASKRGR
jgi:catechol 2,3-dioxygenase-like lactoylglutathione lyase family enzyme